MRFLGSKFANSLYKYFTTGHQRSVKAKKNIIASFFIRGASILISLLLVPLIINYINPSRYGVVVSDEKGTVSHVVEKPDDPPSNQVIAGFYVFSPSIFSAIDHITVSQRGEYETKEQPRN